MDTTFFDFSKFNQIFGLPPQSIIDLTVVDATNASPIVIETSTPHNFLTNMIVEVRFCTGNTAANGNWQITVIDGTHFSLNGSTGNGAYTGGGQVPQTSVLWIGTSTMHMDFGKGPFSIFPIGVTSNGFRLSEGMVRDSFKAITNASNTTPITITTAAPHGITAPGTLVEITGVLGNTAANGQWAVAAPIGANTFNLLGSAGNGAYAGGGLYSVYNGFATEFIQWDIRQDAESVQRFVNSINRGLNQ
jgi:hypothetical protein